MRSLRSDRRRLATPSVTIRRSRAGAPGTTATLISAMALLTGAVQLYAQSRTATASLVLIVRPEERLQVQNGSVALKIRLARGTAARLWVANSCTSPSPESSVIIASGTFTIPLNTLRPASDNPSPPTTQVCLMSSDGVLNDSQPVEILGTGNRTAAPGTTPIIAPSGIPAYVPEGWALTSRAGTATWSNP